MVWNTGVFMSNKISNILIVIFVIAFVLRITGITNGFPFIFHPDEPTIIRSALAIRFNINPAHFDWPHLYIYLNYFVYMIFSKLRDLLPITGMRDFVYFSLPIIWDDTLIFYLLTRVLTVVFGTLTILPIYYIGKNLFNVRAGLLASAAITLAPLHVWYSHYALADIPMLFFASLALYFCSKILFVNKSINYILAGFFIGLAATTKYNGILMFIPFILAHIFRIFSEKEERIFKLEEIENIIYAGISCIVAFLLGTPFAALDFNTFIRTDGPKGALWQFVNIGSVGFIERIRNFIDIIFFQFGEDLGYSFSFLFICAFAFLFIRFIRTKKFFEYKDLIYLVSSTLILIFYMSGAEKTRSHYFLVVYPLIILSGAGILETFLEIIKIRSQNLIIFVIFITPLFFSLRATFMFYQEDSRVQFYKWSMMNFKNNTTIYYNGDDLSQVFNKLKFRSQKINDVKSLPKGSIFVISNDKENNAKLLRSFDDYLRKGPYINVYETIK